MPRISSAKSHSAALICAAGLLCGAAVWSQRSPSPAAAPTLVSAGWSLGWQAPPPLWPGSLATLRGPLSPWAPAPQPGSQPDAAENLEAKADESGDFSEFIATRAKAKTWRYATKTVRAAITAALDQQTARPWKFIALHSSATASGSAKAFDYYHRRVKGMENGLAYHFVITNGEGGPDGQIQAGPRWLLQEAGGHLRSDTQNEVSIGICLVGDFQTTAPTTAQLQATDELLQFLRARLGEIPIATHRQVNSRPTLCPGKKFPAKLFVSGKAPVE